VTPAKSVKLSALKLRGGWDRDLDQDTLDGLVEQIQIGAVLPPIGVDETRHVVYGYHRIAAHKLLKRTEIRVDVVPQVAVARSAIAENLRRRHLTREQLADAIRRYQEIDQPKPPEPEDDAPKIGRPKSPERAARLATAKALGVSEETVRRAEAKPEPEPEGPALSEHASMLRDAFAGLASMLVRIQGTATALDKVLEVVGGPLLMRNAAAVGKVRRLAKEAAEEARAAMPEAPCAYCKGAEKNCPACKGTAYLTAAQVKAVPEELRAV
jgi:ParB-like chromosome segregation protein Spo0J